MANYEAAVAITYIGFTALILWLSTKMEEDTLAKGGIKWFLTAISFYLILLGFGTARNFASANLAPAGVVHGLEVSYWVLMITFIMILFIMAISILKEVFEMIKVKRKVGRMRL